MVAKLQCLALLGVCFVSWTLYSIITIWRITSYSFEGENGDMNSNSVTSSSNFRKSTKRPRNLLRKLDKSKNYDVCVVGSGLSGTVFAERHANILQQSVLVIDKRDHIGGNCFDYIDEETGILMNKYGAHLFHTNDEKAWRYIVMHPNSPKWKRWDHKVIANIDGSLVPVPVNIETVNVLLKKNLQSEAEMDDWLSSAQIPCDNSVCLNAEEMAKSRVGNDLFNLIFKDYTLKQWNKDPKELDALVTARIPVRNNFDTRYFSDKYQVLPSEGYTKWFESLLFDKERIDVILNLDYFKRKHDLDRMCSKTIYTGPIDQYFQNKRNSNLESLEYRSIEFKIEKFMGFNGFKQPNSVVNYPSRNYPFTRIIEYKHFLHQTSKHTLVVKEISKDEGDPYYPVPTQRNLDLYEKYKAMAEKEEEEHNVIFVGRLANYKYFNMDTAIVNALDLFYETAGKPFMPDMHELFT